MPFILSEKMWSKLLLDPKPKEGAFSNKGCGLLKLRE